MSDEDFMRVALDEAHAALEHGDVPVGAVGVLNGEVIAAAHNEREVRRDPTAHAEVLLLRRIAEELEDWRLTPISVYVTVEPCPMCAGALVASRVKRLVYGAPDPRAGAAWSLYNILQDPRLPHRCEVRAGVLREECSGLIAEFFRRRRDSARFL
ncbi:MAG: tRNA adenosine(34) deaminase TadA [Actinomycetota bacterium]|nr:tRNA adenosine(34) deaminase TadA [Actinomycetota bacterium]